MESWYKRDTKQRILVDEVIRVRIGGDRSTSTHFGSCARTFEMMITSEALATGMEWNVAAKTQTLSRR